MDDQLCLLVRSRPGESEADFKSRLSQFWTHMLRNRPDEFELVYAETTAFERDGSALTRRYLLSEEVAAALDAELAAAGIAHDPIDPDDLYSKYEATPPEWMQIEH